MAIPTLLIAGYLGCGKTTLINRLLKADHGLRIAAVVNDFGAINIDAALLESASDGLVSLKNGCICCTLQGDLLRSLATLVRRDPAPDVIVIETSGISDPAEIIRSLLDPVIFKAAALETVLTLVDAAQATDAVGLMQDPLWVSQAKSSDILLVTKSDLIANAATAELTNVLETRFGPRTVFVLGNHLPMELMFGQGAGEARLVAPVRPVSSPMFRTTTWTAIEPLSIGRFHAALDLMSRRLLRAKGVVTFTERPAQPLLLQLVGTRATLVTSPVPPGEGLAAVIVLIAKADATDLADITALLDASVN